LKSSSVSQTKKYAASLALSLSPGCTLILTGDLGAGKTTFVKALARSIGVRSVVTSPTFTLLKEYKGKIDLFHLDLYRIRTIEEIHELALEDIYGADGITVIEWGDKLTSLLPDDYIEIEIKNPNGNKRDLVVKAHGNISSGILDQWSSRIQKEA
jgi:tRNA threonylcarbamoyladenosine biosynthesis protein TsaE